MPTRSIPLLPGFEILERIGRGAGAVISLARDTTNGGRLVAIKHIVRQSPEDDRFIAQAENEYEVARQLDHECIRRYYNIARVQKWFKTRQLFLVMEFVDGQRLEDHRPEKLVDMIPIFKRVAEGLHAIHTAGYAHADIKPNNILLTKDGGVKLIDFGQSCPLGHTKERVQGTPDYIAPEQVHRLAIDQRTDIFNFGATMYWILTGKYFKTLMPVLPTAAKRIAVEAERGNEPPHELNLECPLPLSKLVMECCETSKEKRPRDMRNVLSRLEVVEHMLERPKPPRSTSAPDISLESSLADDDDFDASFEDVFDDALNKKDEDDLP
jgi:serine/threonine protein kinase